jgi:nitrous-oxide reductase
VIDLHDFETKQIVVNPFFKSEHGGAFVTPNTEYVMEAAQYAAPLLDDGFVPLEEFNDKYRGGLTYWSFNKEKGRIVPEKLLYARARPLQSGPLRRRQEGQLRLGLHQLLLHRALCRRHRARTSALRGRLLLQGHRFLHVTNWKKAEELVKAGKVKQEKGMYFIPMEQAIAEGLLYLVPEPKSPHGVDVTPDGKYIIVAGKLDSHVSVYSFEKIMKAIADGNFEGKDPYGVPIIADAGRAPHAGRPGAGSLHTQFDSKPCVAYTSLYVDSQVAKYDYCEGKVLDKLSIHYNIGHLMTMEGDTVNPQGKYLVALNKLAIDRSARRPAASAEPSADRHQRRQDAAHLRHAAAARRAPLCRRHSGREAATRRALQIRLEQPDR